MRVKTERKSPLLNIDEAAEILRRSESTVRWFVHTGQLASVKIGRRRQIRRRDLAKFIGCEPEELVA